MKSPVILLLCFFVSSLANSFAVEPLKLRKDSHVVLVGDGLGSRMAEYGYFEALVQMQYPRDDSFYPQSL